MVLEVHRINNKKYQIVEIFVFRKLRKITITTNGKLTQDLLLLIAAKTSRIKDVKEYEIQVLSTFAYMKN